MGGLPSGYNRDLQEMKRPLFSSFEITKQTLQIMILAVTNLQVNAEALEKTISPELFAAHHAYQLVTKEEMPFRQAYQFVGSNLSQIPHYDSHQVLREAKHLGATGNLAFDNTLASAKREVKIWKTRQQKQQAIISKLLLIQ
jgi:argininosuccinate lyase